MPSANIIHVDWITPMPISLPHTAPAKARMAVTEISMEPTSSTHNIPAAMTMLMEPPLRIFM